MLRELKFVQGAVAKKDFLPAMTHFAIEKGFVRSYNGKLALCAPIAFNIDCKPKADQFVNAITQCSDTMQLSMSSNKRLRIVSNGFKAFIDCIDEDTPHVQPEGDRVGFDGEVLLNGLKAIYPFIGDDSSRLWATGVLMRGESMFATNNVIAVQYWTGTNTPREVNIPRIAINEMLRIDEPPTHAQMTDNSITFHYSDKRWVRSQLLAVDWPDMLGILNKADNPLPIDTRLFDGLEKLRKFTDKAGRVYIKDGMISTTAKDDADEGARYEVPGLLCEGIYNIEMLMLLKDTATHADFSWYPAPCTFYNDRMRGAIVGMKM